MRRPVLFGFLFLAVSAVGVLGARPFEVEKVSETVEAGAPGSVARGRYIAHHLSMCVQCHTPRGVDGEMVEGELFGGAVLPEGPPSWTEDWTTQSADLRALAHADPERIVQVLMTGERPNGTSPHSPMPPFRMIESDARAVVAYLQSLEREDRAR